MTPAERAARAERDMAIYARRVEDAHDQWKLARQKFIEARREMEHSDG